MQTLLEFIKKYYYWVLFVTLEVVSLVLLFHYNNYQASVWYTSANQVAGQVNSWYTEGVSYIHLKDVNANLTQQNAFLQTEIGRLRMALDSTQTPPTANDLAVSAALAGYHFIPAKVVSSSLHRDDNYIVINRGKADGITTDLGVVGGGGVVGIIFLTGEHYSLVMPTINVKSNISCRIRHKGYFGYLQWAGGSTASAYLSDIPRYAKVKVGDYVETSGYSSVFPPGIFVGKVKGVANAPDGLSLQLKVNLGTDFGRLSDVSVVINKERPEIDSLRAHFTNFETPSN